MRKLLEQSITIATAVGVQVFPVKINTETNRYKEKQNAEKLSEVETFSRQTAFICCVRHKKL